MLDAAIPNRYDTRSVAVGRPTTSQKVVIVNGNRAILELLETVLQAGHYDVVFVESNERAYSQIRRVLPDLVILCVGSEDLEGFRVLSMLKLDDDTRGIPVLTYTMESENEDLEEDIPEPFDVEMLEILAPKRVEVMH